MRFVFSALAAVFFCMAIFVAAPARADDAVEAHLDLKNHAFTPSELDVPAGQKIKLFVKNEDDASAEFESKDLDREKVAPANTEIHLFIGPLQPGTYGFFDDYHRDTATGKITAK